MTQLPDLRSPDDGHPLPDNCYWNNGKICYVVSHEGQDKRGSSRGCSVKQAIKARDAAKIELLKGEAVINRKVRIAELLDDYIKTLKRKEERRGDYAPRTSRITGYTVDKHVRPFFGQLRADKLSTKLLDEYCDKRIAEYKQRGEPDGQWVVSLNRELTYLRAAMKIGMNSEPKKVARCPKFPIDAKAEKERRRRGYMTDEFYNKLMPELAPHLRPLLPLVTFSPVRAKEARFIQRDQVDWERHTLNLRDRHTKEGPGRTVGMPDIAFDKMWEWERVTREQYPHCPWLFHFHGKQLGDWKTAWNAACRRAGLVRMRKNPDGTPKLHTRGKDAGKPIYENLVKFHDTRRTAITVQLNAENTAADSQKTAGHSTLDVHMGYDQATALRVVAKVNAFTKKTNYGEKNAKVIATEPVREEPPGVKVEQVSGKVTLDFTALRELGAMFKEGLLTNEEFQGAKRALGLSVSPTAS
jgi:integrase